MSTLRKDLRTDLEKTIVKARTIAEQAATTALQSLAIDQAKPFPHMDAQAVSLRNRLRARGRAAGDVRETSGAQSLNHLAQLVAYEHWHRMIFARFLAENGLLLEPEYGVSISLEDAEELARESGEDLWELAGSYAQLMLPGVFRNDDAALEVTLAREDRVKLETLLASLEPAVFTADDSLGWTYQFWQTQRKEEVNKSGVKIGADEISPVTQLFTEDYMVEFLLHNTLGAWWAGKLGPIVATTEEEARAQAALPTRDGIAITWTYLRFIQDEETQAWKPAAGTFEGWPREAKEITFLDPCMGSGHFPVFALPLLARLRMEEENLSAAEAVHAVLRDNIHGLELDPRCCQIGAFNLALTAWKIAGHQPLPELHIACCGIAPQGKLADWVALAGDSDRLQRGMERLYKLFEQAPVLGSLINPRLGGGDLLEADFHELQPLLEQAMEQEAGDEAAHEMAVTAQGLAKAAEMLAGQFTLVATNVPFLGRGKQIQRLKDYCDSCHTDSRSDLSTTFVDRCEVFCSIGGSAALVSPQNWWFSSSYKDFRKRILISSTLVSACSLGEEAWQAFGDRGPFASLITITSEQPGHGSSFFGIDALADAKIEDKIIKLISSEPSRLDQSDQLQNPDQLITISESRAGKRLGDYASSTQGLKTGDDEYFCGRFWEQVQVVSPWRFYQGSVSGDCLQGGLEHILRWENDGEGIARKQGLSAWGKNGVLVGLMRNMAVTRYFGHPFASSVSPLICVNEAHSLAVWSYCASNQFRKEVRRIDKRVCASNSSLQNVPFDLAHWQKVAAEKYPDGLPKPHSDDPTQWLFNGHPKGSEQPLQVAAARLLGYRWPRQTGSSFPDCPALGTDGLEAFADEDGIVCLPPLNREAAAAERLRKLLDEAFDNEPWNERQLLAGAGSKKATLEDWLRDDFFEQHCKLFHHRPFVWHIWDGRPDGFHALVNYHQLAAPNGDGYKLLENLTYSYLGDWIRRQQAGVTQNTPGSEERLLAAQELQDELKNILTGEPPYDLFVRWKPLYEQAIGWNPDLNDGVRLNIRPFLKARDVKKKDAGILRWKPNVKWTKDRGKEPPREKQDFPWFWTWDETTPDFPGGNTFDGNRWNDLHYSTATKQSAREAQQAKQQEEHKS